MMLNYLSHAEHLCQPQIYDTLKQIFYWVYMAADVNYILQNCTSCAENHLKYCDRSNVYNSPSIRPLEFVAINSFRPFPKSVEGNLHILFPTNRYSWLMRAVLTLKITVSHVANVYINQCLTPCGIPTYLLADNGTLLVSQFFATVGALFRARRSTTTAYHPQASIQAERLNKTILARHQRYIAKH